MLSSDFSFSPKQYESSYKECMDDEAAYRNHGMRYAYGPVMKSREQED